jgi:tetratricopeptide (TPR) repeat protein
MRKLAIILTLLLVTSTLSCTAPVKVVSNPWLVPFQDRRGSSLSRSQMRAMVKLADIYKAKGMEKEYQASMVTAIELYAGDKDVTFELINFLIDKINLSRADLLARKNQLTSLGVDAKSLTRDSVPPDEPAHSKAVEYLNARDGLEIQYQECYRVLANACWQIPYDPELYYRIASLQYLRAEEDGDVTKYKDAINYLKRAIASDSGHLESYQLIALAYEKLGDKDRAIRFWQLYETIYEIAPQVLGKQVLTPDRERFHQDALQHLKQLGAKPEE